LRWAGWWPKHAGAYGWLEVVVDEGGVAGRWAGVGLLAQPLRVFLWSEYLDPKVVKAR
jgi:hypothetical protein